MITQATPSAAEIVVIEDDPGDALLAEEFLAEEASGFLVVWAPSLAKGVAAITPATRCILLDLGLPDAQGVTALETIEQVAPNVPVVVLTGYGDRVAGVDAVAAGAQDYLVKGEVTPATLSRSIRYAIARAGNEERDLRLLEAGLRREENHRLALGLRPRLLVRDPAIRCESLYQPAGHSNLLGGDFLDAVELGDGTVRLVLGDVAGHGPEEAALGVSLRVGWRSLVLTEMDDCDTLAELEKLLVVERSHPHAFATVCDVSISADRSSARFCLAGHPPPILVRDGRSSLVDVPAQRPLGVPGSPLAATEVALPEAWTMLLYTDGVFEGRVEGGGRMGLQAFVDAVVARVDANGLGATDLHELVASSETSNQGPLDDDVALLLCARTPR